MIHSTKNDFGASDDQDKEIFWGNWHLEGVEASEVAEAAEVNEDEEVYKAWKIPTEDFRVIQVLEFNNLRTNMTLFLKKKIVRIMLNFSTFFIRGRWGCVRSKKFQMIDQA